MHSSSVFARDVDDDISEGQQTHMVLRDSVEEKMSSPITFADSFGLTDKGRV